MRGARRWIQPGDVMRCSTTAHSKVIAVSRRTCAPIAYGRISARAGQRGGPSSRPRNHTIVWACATRLRMWMWMWMPSAAMLIGRYGLGGR
jgi:hypothetical protein